MKTIHLLPIVLIFFNCSKNDGGPTENSFYADVTQVQVSGQQGDYRFSVTVKSPDTGCDQYADWWEILSEGGELVHRRILLHSHVNEQPFTRSAVDIQLNSDQVIFIRAHMNNRGYGGAAMKGTVEAGFEPTTLAPDFAAEVEGQQPLPDECTF